MRAQYDARAGLGVWSGGRPTWFECIFLRMLYLVGLGLCDPSDITVKGLEVVRRASRVYLEAYTSILISSSKADLVGVRKRGWNEY